MERKTTFTLDRTYLCGMECDVAEMCGPECVRDACGQMKGTSKKLGHAQNIEREGGRTGKSGKKKKKKRSKKVKGGRWERMNIKVQTNCILGISVTKYRTLYVAIKQLAVQ